MLFYFFYFILFKNLVLQKLPQTSIDLKELSNLAAANAKEEGVECMKNKNKT